MTPELIQAVAERIKVGRTEAEIITELLATGYTEGTASAAYAAAKETVYGAGAGAAVLTAAMVPPTTLISYEELFQETWRVTITLLPLFVKASLAYLVIFAVLGFVLLVPVATISLASTNLTGIVLTMLVFPAAALLTGSLFSLTLIRIICMRREGIFFWKNLLWVAQNFVGVTLAMLYTAVVIQLGYLILVIPGIIASVYLMFTLPVLVSGKATGFAALTESTRLVQGNFWPILARFAVTNGAFILGVAVITLAGSVFMVALFEASLALLLLALPVYAFALYWLLCSLVILFESVLVSHKPQAAFPVSRVTNFFKIVVAVAAMLIFGTIATFIFAAFAITSI